MRYTELTIRAVLPFVRDLRVKLTQDNDDADHEKLVRGDYDELLTRVVVGVVTEALDMEKSDD